MPTNQCDFMETCVVVLIFCYVEHSPFSDFIFFSFLCQAYNLSRDHKPDLEIEKERILKAGGFIHAGRVNGSLNLARAIGTHGSVGADFI